MKTKQTNPTNMTNQTNKTILAAFCLSFLLFGPAHTFAAEFDGKLKEVKITDAAGINQPPTAVINYTQDGDTFTFDASGSNDSDGSITEYKWNFGDGNIAFGANVNHSYADTQKSYDVTMTVTDDKNGIAMEQIQVVPGGIMDQFLTDTSANYTAISGALSVSAEVAHGKLWSHTIAYHNTALATPNHWIQADVVYSGFIDSGGLAIRINPATKTGYRVSFGAGRINLEKFVGSQVTWLALYDGKYPAGKYTVKVVVVGNRITVSVNGILRITKDDGTYLQGLNVGPYFSRGNVNSDVTVDNLMAGGITP
ncbi:MAG: hypothetical protein BM485_11210 [Desulfobulbaceae bacterium DB1]|nr:MAG: hypothetical protein BM485_11210 [Desulfobulbaceae bacterium DB1]